MHPPAPHFLRLHHPGQRRTFGQGSPSVALLSACRPGASSRGPRAAPGGPRLVTYAARRSRRSPTTRLKPLCSCAGPVRCLAATRCYASTQILHGLLQSAGYSWDCGAAGTVLGCSAPHAQLAGRLDWIRCAAVDANAGELLQCTGLAGRNLLMCRSWSNPTASKC